MDIDGSVADPARSGGSGQGEGLSGSSRRGGGQDHGEVTEEEEGIMRASSGGGGGGRQEARDPVESHRQAMLEESELLVLVFDKTRGNHQLRTDMNRFGLLEACRKTSSTSATPGAKRGKGGVLHLRDIRCLQGVSEPALLVRRDAIVVSLDPIKAIITCETAFLVVQEGMDSVLEPLLARLREGNRDTDVDMPFEFIALETLLITLVNFHATEVKNKLSEGRQLLRKLKGGISNSILNRIMRFKKSIEEKYESISGAYEALEEVQADDDHMAMMYLTKHRDGQGTASNGIKAHEHYNLMQVELLLDAYAIDFVTMAKQLSLMSKEIDATEDFIRFRLDKARNKLIFIDVTFGMVGMWLAANASFSGFYGMNLPNGLYADGTVKPGGKFDPPTGGTHYAGPFGDFNGPSWEFWNLSVGAAGVTLFGILATLLIMRSCGLSRV